MSEAPPAADDAVRQEDEVADGSTVVVVRRRPFRRFLSILAKTALSLTAGLLLLLTAIALLLDTDLGHRLILDRIAAIAPESGFRIRIGRIEGSIWGKTELRDVRLYDPEGLWAEAPRIDLEFEPFAWFANRISIHEVESELAILHRLPRFEPGRGRGRPTKYDLHIGRLEVAQLRVEAPVTGERRTARIAGAAEFRRGRALAHLDAVMRGGGDRLQLILDAAPADDRFDLDMRLDAPAAGVFAKIIDAEDDVRLEVHGDGSWANWNGRAELDMAGVRASEMRLMARSGRYGAQGWLAPAALLEGDLATLGGARTAVNAEGTLAEGVLEGRLAAQSNAVRLLLRGGVDIREDEFRDLGVAAELLRPEALVSGVSGSRLRGTALVNGAFDDARIAYRVSADRLATDEATFLGVTGSGEARLTRGRLILPLVAGVRAVDGLGGDFEEILANLRLTGTFRLDGNRMSSDNIVLVSNALRARLGFGADMRSGRYTVQGAAAMERYDLGGVGLVDLNTDLRAFGGPGTFSLNGNARGVVRRLDSDVIRNVAGGAPTVQTGLTGGPGGLRLIGLRFSSPKLNLAGDATRRPDGTLVMAMNGRHQEFGPVALRLDGPLERPNLGLTLADPGSGFTNVALRIAPADSGFTFAGRGESPVGPFDARGSTLLAQGRPAAVRIAALHLSGATASGMLRPVRGGVAGHLDFTGPLSGPLTFSRGAIGQRVEANMVASNARIGDIPIGSGTLAGYGEIGRGDDPAVAASVRFGGIAEQFWPMAGIEDVALAGPFSLSADVRGTIGAPEITGGLRISQGRLTSEETGTAITALDTAATFDGMRLNFDSFSGQTAGGGRVSGSGFYDLSGPIEARLETVNALLLDKPNLRARVTGPVVLRSDGSGGTITGNLRASEASIRFRNSDRRGRGRGGEGGGSAWALALRLAGERVTVRGSGLDSQWRAALQVGGTTEAPTVTGEAALLGGTYRVLGQAFPLTSGRMTFDGRNPPDPELDIVAQTPGGLIAGGVRITGRASRPEIGYATPPMPFPVPERRRRRSDAVPPEQRQRPPQARRRAR